MPSHLSQPAIGQPSFASQILKFWYPFTMKLTVFGRFLKFPHSCGLSHQMNTTPQAAQKWELKHTEKDWRSHPLAALTQILSQNLQEIRSKSCKPENHQKYYRTWNSLKKCQYDQLQHHFFTFQQAVHPISSRFRPFHPFRSGTFKRSMRPSGLGSCSSNFILLPLF